MKTLTPKVNDTRFPRLTAAIRRRLTLDQLRDVASHGADAGWAGFTYYTDTLRFFSDHKKDILKLANAILRFSEMPPDGRGNFLTDTAYLANIVAPLARRMKNRYKSQWKALGCPRPGIGAKAAKKVKTLK